MPVRSPRRRSRCPDKCRGRRAVCPAGLIVLGFILEFSGLLEIGIVLLCCGLLFQLITLPVEFDASRRAKIQLKELGLITDDELSGVKRVLTAAAMTYVAGFLAEALYIARILLLSRRRN